MRAEGSHRLHVVTDKQHRPTLSGDALHLTETLLLERRVTDREHFVDDQDLRLEVGGDGERKSHVHAARVALDGSVQELPISEKSTISSNLRVISTLVMPRIAPFRKMFSRPVSSGWKPVPTSSRLPTRPWISPPCRLGDA